MSHPLLFDRALRRVRRDRAVTSGGDRFLHECAFEEVLDRLRDVKRDFARALLLGCLEPSWRARLEAVVEEVILADPSPRAARRCAGIVADEDRLPFADGSFDLIVAVGTLDSVDDLPGALLLARRALRPDGLFVGAVAGAGSLPRLRRAMLAADVVTGGAAARTHPAIDVRTAGDLLARAGFVLPVADTDSLDVSYAGLPALVADLRAHGATNILSRRSGGGLGRKALAAAAAAFNEESMNGRTTERIEILYLSGWSPSASNSALAARRDAPAPAPRKL